jgi:hypothetical protein
MVALSTRLLWFQIIVLQYFVTKFNTYFNFTISKSKDRRCNDTIISMIKKTIFIFSVENFKNRVEILIMIFWDL